MHFKVSYSEFSGKNSPTNYVSLFPVVKKAHQQILDPGQKEIAQSIIESAEKEVKKARKKRMKDGVRESELGSYEEELLIATRKQFAVHELRKRKFDRQLKEHSVCFSIPPFCVTTPLSNLISLITDGGSRKRRRGKRKARI